MEQAPGPRNSSLKATLLTLATTVAFSQGALASTVQCRELFDRSSTVEHEREQIPAAFHHGRNLPEGFQLSVWRYNSGLKNKDGSTSFDHAQLDRLKYESESGTYYSHGADGVYNNKLLESPESERHRLNGGLLFMVRNPIKEEMESQSEGEGIFERNQSFTFDVYSKLGYLSAEEAELQKSISRNFLKPEQVTYVEATEERDTESLMKEFGKIPKQARLEADSNAWTTYQSHFADFDAPQNQFYELKVGTSWFIAGQVDHHAYPVALEASPLANPIDRTKYKYIFEVGRAGQDKNYGFEETVRAQIFYAVNDVLASGGRLEDVYFFAHSMDAKRAVVFKRKYSMKEFSRYQDPARKEELVLIAPLAKLLEIYDLGEFSNAIYRIRETVPASKSFSSVDLYRWILDSREMANQRLVIGNTRVQIRDFSNLRAAIYEQAANLKAFSAHDREAFAAAISSSSPPMESRDNVALALERSREHSQGPYVRVEGITYTHPIYQRETLMNVDNFLYRENAVEIFPDVTEEKLTPKAAQELILSVYDHYITLLKNRGVADPAGLLRQQGVRFALTVGASTFRTPSEKTAQQNYWYVHRPSVTYTQMGGFGGFNMTQRTKQVLWESWSYRVEQIAELRHEHLATPVAKMDASHGVEFVKDVRLLAP